MNKNDQNKIRNCCILKFNGGTLEEFLTFIKQDKDRKVARIET